MQMFVGATVVICHFLFTNDFTKVFYRYQAVWWHSLVVVPDSVSDEIFAFQSTRYMHLNFRANFINELTVYRTLLHLHVHVYLSISLYKFSVVSRYRFCDSVIGLFILAH